MTDIEVTAKSERVLEPAVEAARAYFRFSVVGIVRAEEAELTNGAAGLVFAGKEAKLERAGARTIMAAGPVEITRGGAGALLSLGDIHMAQAGAAILAAKSTTVRDGGFIGLAVTPRLNVEEGGRVLAGPREVAMLGLVAALAAVVVILTSGLTSRRRRQGA